MNLEDRAQEHEAQLWAMANLNRPVLPPPAAPGDPDYGPEFCDACGAEMPELRRADRRRLCTPCQSLAERRKVR